MDISETEHGWITINPTIFNGNRYGKYTRYIKFSYGKFLSHIALGRLSCLIQLR